MFAAFMIRQRPMDKRQGLRDRLPFNFYLPVLAVPVDDCID